IVGNPDPPVKPVDQVNHPFHHLVFAEGHAKGDFSSKHRRTLQCFVRLGGKKTPKDRSKIRCDIGHQFRMVLCHIASTGLLDDRADLRMRPVKVPPFEYRMSTDSHQAAMIGVTPRNRTWGNSLALAFCEARRGQSSQRCSTPFPLGLSSLAAIENGAEWWLRRHRG